MRKSVDVVITPENCPSEQGRDYHKTYRLTEMSAWQAEEWANRATLALFPRLAQEVPPETAEALRENPSMIVLQRVGLLLGALSFPELKELARELMGCVQIVMDAGPRKLGLGFPADDPYGVDIEEVETIRFLRQEVLNLHSGFTRAAALFNLVAAGSQMSPSNDLPISALGSPSSSAAA